HRPGAARGHRHQHDLDDERARHDARGSARGHEARPGYRRPPRPDLCEAASEPLPDPLAGTRGRIVLAADGAPLPRDRSLRTAHGIPRSIRARWGAHWKGADAYRHPPLGPRSPRALVAVLQPPLENGPGPRPHPPGPAERVPCKSRRYPRPLPAEVPAS